jgi:pimeloyl-ACP methyl ester carboxylesterase
VTSITDHGAQQVRRASKTGLMLADSHRRRLRSTRLSSVAAFRAQIGVAGPRQSGKPQPCDPTDLRAIQILLRECGQRGRDKGVVREVRCPLRVSLSSRQRQRISIRGPRGRSTRSPTRGPLLIISGEKDHTAPWAIANASFKQQRDNEGFTEIVEMPNRGHAFTIDRRWREVANTALEFVKRFV